MFCERELVGKSQKDEFDLERWERVNVMLHEEQVENSVLFRLFSRFSLKTRQDITQENRAPGTNKYHPKFVILHHMYTHIVPQYRHDILSPCIFCPPLSTPSV